MRCIIPPHSYLPKSMGFINVPPTRSFLTAEVFCKCTCIIEKCLTFEADWEKIPQHTGQGSRRRDRDVSGGQLKEAGEVSKQKGK